MYCSHCGKEVADEAVICVHCGCRIKSTDSKNRTLGLVAKIFMIISTVALAIGTFGIALAWTIPMTIAVSNRLDDEEPIGLGLKICTLIFVNIVSGILLLCMDD